MKILAPAKINLYLAIQGLRPDGYHDLETIFHTVGLYDELEVSKAAEISLRVSGKEAPPDFPSGPENLVWRAAREFLSAFRIASGVKIHLKKNIPVQAGLGGGSSDAAAVLKACRKLFLKRARPADKQTLRKIARGLGADVPFFLEGGCALAGGVGDKLTRLPSCRFWAVVVKPRLGLSTAEVYRWYDRDSAGPQPLTPALQSRKMIELVRLRRPLADWAGFAFNSFEDAVFSRVPEIGWIKSALLAEGCFCALLSGSGSALFGLVKSEAEGERVRRALKSPEVKVWVAAAL